MRHFPYLIHFVHERALKRCLFLLLVFYFKNIDLVEQRGSWVMTWQENESWMSGRRMDF